MPEKEIIPNLGGDISTLPSSITPSYKINNNYTNLSEDAIVAQAFGSTPTKASPVQDIPISSFSFGNRYNNVIPFTDPEEMYAQQQSSAAKWGNALTKMLGTATTSFVSGTVGLVNGVIDIPLNGWKLSSLYDNETTRAMDALSKQMENSLPNYYTQAETNAEWYSPKNWMTANFFADKLLKNLGYSLGSLGAGMAWSSVLRNIGIINNLTKSGQNLEGVLAATDEAMSSVPTLQRYKSFSSILAQNAKSAIAPILKDSDRIITSALGTFGEASMEALQNMNSFRDNLISEYKSKYGENPTGTALDEINSYAEKVGNNTWGLNTLLLSATNYIQLPKILSSSRKAENIALNNITENASKQFVQSPFSVIDKARGFAKNLFSSSEAFEEGMQYAIQKGTEDFFNRAYQNKEDVDSMLSNFLNSSKSVLTTGVSKALSDKEGLESILIGGISGGLQQIRGNIKEQGLFGTGGERQQNTLNALEALNKTNLSQKLQDATNYLAIGIASQEKRQSAIGKGQVLEEKDYEHDYTMSYILPRVKYGKEESIYQEIDGYKQQASNPEGFAELQASGIVLPNETMFQFINRLDAIKELTKNTTESYQSITDKYSNLVDKEGNKLFTPNVVDRLVYAKAKIEEYNKRIPELATELSASKIDVQTILEDVIAKTPRKEATQEALKLINDLPVVSTVKDDLKQKLQDVITLTSLRKEYIDEYDNIIKDPETVSAKEADDKVQIYQKNDKGKPKPFTAEIGKTYSIKSEALFKDGNSLILNPKLTILSKTLGGELQVELPNGKTTFVTPESLKNYQLQEESNLEDFITEEVNNVINKILSKPKWKNLNIDPSISLLDKINIINELNNPELSSLIQKEVRKATAQKIQDVIDAKLKEQEELEKINKNKDSVKDILDIQTELNNSANEGSNNGEKIYEPNAKKSVEAYLNSTISPSDFYNRRYKNTPKEVTPFLEIISNDELNDEQKNREIENEIGNQEAYFEDNASAHQKRERKFLNSLTLESSQEYRTAVISYKNAGTLGLEKMYETFNPYDTKNSDDTALFTVFVKLKDNIPYLVDENGEITNIPLNIKDTSFTFDDVKDTVVFSVLGKVLTDKIDVENRIRANDKYDKDSHKKLREQYIEQPTPLITDFTISNGFSVPSATPVSLSSSISSKENIVVATTNQYAFGSEIIDTTPGFVYVKTEEAFIPASTKKFSKKEQEQLLHAINTFVQEYRKPKKERSDLFQQAKSFLESNILFAQPKENTPIYKNQIYTNVETEGDLIKQITLNFSLNGEDFAIPLSQINSNQNLLKQWLEQSYFNVSLIYKNKNEAYYALNTDNTTTRYNSYIDYIKSNDMIESFSSKKEIGGNKRFGKYAILNTKPVFTSVVPTSKEEDLMNDLGNAFQNSFGSLVSKTPTKKSSLSDRLKAASVEDNPLDLMKSGLASMFSEESLPETQEEKPNIDISNATNFSIYDEYSVERMSPEEKADFTEFMNANLPQYTIKEVEELINATGNRKAWGKLENNVITFYKNARKGTGYHEAFEGVWKDFTNNTEKESILSELKARPGTFADRESGKTIAYSSATNHQLKEKLADEFADYILNRPKTSTGLKGFFEKVLKFIKNFLKGLTSNKSLVDDLFSKIEKGKFSGIPVPKYTQSNPEFSLIPKSRSVRDVNILVNNMFVAYFNEILANNGDFFSLETYTNNNYWNAVRERFSMLKEQIGEEDFEKIIKLTILKFNTVGLKFKEDVISIDDETKTNEFLNDKAKLMAKQTSPWQIKFLLNSLFEAERNSDGTISPKKDSLTGGVITLPFSRTYIQIQEAVLGATGFDDMISKLKKIGEENPNYTRLLQWLVNDKTLNMNNLSYNSLRMLVAFYKNFNKQKPTPFTIEKQGDAVILRRMDYGGIADLKQSWARNIYQSIIKDDSPFFEKKNNLYQRKPNYSSKITKNVIGDLAKLGIDFPLDVYESLSDTQKSKVFEQAKAIFDHILAKPVKKITPNNLGVEQRLTNLAQFLEKQIKEYTDTTFENSDGERQQLFIGNNVPSAFENVFNSVSTIEELYAQMPHLKSAANSIFLKLGGKYFTEEGKRTSEKIHLGYIENVPGKWDRKTDSSKMEENQRLMAYVNSGFQNYYEIGNAGTASIPWNLQVPPATTISEQADNVEKTYHKQFYDYYLAEVELSKNPSQAAKLANKEFAYELRFFKDIVSSKNLSLEEFTKQFDSFIEKVSNNLKSKLISQRELIEGSDKTFTIPNLLQGVYKHFGDETVLSEKDVTKLLNTAIINSFAAQVEFHKLIIGDPYLYKIKKSGLDETKRVRSLLSPANPSLTSEVYNSVFSQYINKDVEQGIPYFIDVKNTLNMAILRDVDKVQSLTYDNIQSNEADAQAIHSLPMHMDFLSRHSLLDKEKEDWYKYQSAVDRQKIDSKYPNQYFKYTEEQKAADKKIINSFKGKIPKLSVLKPIVRGFLPNEEGVTIINKMASYPIWFSAVENTANESLFLKMFKENIDYVAFESAAKIGAEKLNDLYVDGKLNPNTFETQTISWNDYYNQVETAYQEKGQTLGSQITKLCIQDMFENGQLLNTEAKEAIEKMETSLEQLTRFNYNKLIDKLGIRDATPQKLREFLATAATNRDVPYHVLQAIRNAEFPIEALPNYIELENVIMASIKDAIVSPSVNGAPHVQIAATLWENLEEGRTLIKDKNGKTVLASNKLKIPTEDYPYMEVMLPAWFRKQLKDSKKLRDLNDEELIKEISPEVLNAIGFRIPTQAMSSMAPIKVVGFIDEVYGKTVVVPSEITAIAGSDFDIDKLNMYLMNTYIDAKGDLKTVPFFGYDEAAINKLKKELDEAVVGLILDYENAPKKEITNLDPNDNGQKELDDFIKASFENEYFSNMHKVLSSKFNVKALVTPLDADPDDKLSFENMAQSMRTALGNERKLSLTSLLFPQTIAAARTLVMQAKQWVGIGALGITGHAQAQRWGMYIDATTLPPLTLITPKNGKIDLGRLLNDDKRVISNELSFFISAVVDAEKNDYITDLIYDKRIVGLAVGMIRMGISGKTIFEFLNQPILREFVNFAKLEGYSNLSNTNLQAKFFKNFPKYNVTPTSFSKENLSVTSNNYGEQRAIFEEFNTLYDLANQLRDFTSATKWDTSNIKNTVQSYRQNILWERAKLQEGNIKINPEFFTSSRSAIIAELYSDFNKNVLSNFSKFQSEEFQSVVNALYSPFVDEYMSDRELEKFGDNIKRSVINYLTQRAFPLSSFLKTFNTYQGSIAEKFNNLPKGTSILNFFEVRENQLFLKPYPKDILEKNLLSEAMLQLREMELMEDGKTDPNGLYQYLFRLGLAQGFGNYSSILSYVDMGDLKTFYSDKLNLVTTDLLAYSNLFENNLFAKNNWKDENLVPTISVKKSFDAIKYKGNTVLLITKNGKPTNLGSEVIELDEEAPIVKFPRFLYGNKQYKDVYTNDIISIKDMKDRREARDPELKQYLVYEKTNIQTVREDGRLNTIYKLTNVYGNNYMYEYPSIPDAPSSFDNNTIPVFPISEQLIINTLEAIKKEVYNPNGFYELKNEPVAPTVKSGSLKLNKEQQDAVNNAVSFIKNGNPKEFYVIEGKAGTGKTTISQEIAKQFSDKNIAVAALSHKAKGVIKDKFKAANIKANFYSLAGLLGQKLDLETGVFDRKEDDYSTPPIAYADIIFIDEASMINEQALDLLFQFKPENTKIIFLGDIGQLPPIRTLQNPYYKNKANLLSKKSPVFDTKNKSKLIERVRQGEENPILPYADFFWENSQKENPELNPVKTPRENILSDKGNLIFTNSFNEIKEQVLTRFKEAVSKGNPNHIKVVTYKNATREAINNYIHDSIFGKNSKQYNNGEIIIFNDNFGDIENATETQVISTSEVLKDDNNLKYIIIDIKIDDFIKKIPVILNESKNDLKNLISKQFSLAFSLKGKPNYRTELDKAWNLKNKFANIDYAYAITSHKSQGSTYDIVVVDEKDINSVGPISNKEKSESIYTALTRARNTAVIISSEKVKPISLPVIRIQNSLFETYKEQLLQYYGEDAEQIFSNLSPKEQEHIIKNCL